MGVGGNAIEPVLNIKKMDKAFDIALFNSNPFSIERLNKTENIWMYPYMNEKSLKIDRWNLDNYELIFDESLAKDEEATIRALFEKQKNAIGNTKLMDDIVSDIKEVINSYQSIDVLVSFDDEEEKVFIRHLSEGLRGAKKKIRWYIIFPFDFEVDYRKKFASEGYELLIKTYPSVSTIHREVMMELGSCLKEQFEAFNKIIYKTIKGQI